MTEANSRPEAILLGTAQDGGLPHVGCRCEHCGRARREPSFRRLPVALGLVDPSSNARFMIDATPDVGAQLDQLDNRYPTPNAKNPLDGILLTHAHIGHYTGLVQFGREVAATQRQPLFGTPAMLQFLSQTAPYNLLFECGNVAPIPLAPDVARPLSNQITVTPWAVPHRSEFSDTVGYVVTGPNRSLLYVPDIDSWERWPKTLEAAVSEVDIALLDATFYDGAELGHRDASEIPHPFVTDTVRRVAPFTSRCDIVLIHLNHNNPLVDPESAAAVAIREAGVAVGTEGQSFAL